MKTIGMYHRTTIPLVIGILLSLLFARLVWGWTNPTQSPPNGNLSLPSAQWTASSTAIYNSNSGNVGVGTSTPGQKFSVYGVIESITGGFKFPDGVTQTVAFKDIGARAYNNANLTLSHDAATVLTFNSERWDTDAIHDTGTNTERLTAKTAGKYLIVAQVVWSAAVQTQSREVYIRLNGTTVIAHAAVKAGSDFGDNMIVTTVYNMAVNDYVEVIARQTTGGNLDIVSSGNKSPEFMMQLIAK